MSAVTLTRMKVDPAGMLAGIMLSFLATAVDQKDRRKTTERRQKELQKESHSDVRLSLHVVLTDEPQN